MPKMTVWIVHISHREGCNTEVFADRPAAVASVAEFVREWWFEEVEELTGMPYDKFEERYGTEKMIERYFHHKNEGDDHESFTIAEQELILP